MELDSRIHHANAHIRVAVGAFGVSVGAIFFFFSVPAAPLLPTLIKEALCECGCEEGRRSSQGSEWRAEVDEGCVQLYENE